jgi:hypothetical protein
MGTSGAGTLSDEQRLVRLSEITERYETEPAAHRLDNLRRIRDETAPQ